MHHTYELPLSVINSYLGPFSPSSLDPTGYWDSEILCFLVIARVLVTDETEFLLAPGPS